MDSQFRADTYDAVADAYIAERHRLRSAKYVRRFLTLLSVHSTVLDLGCGAGAPVDDMLIKAGHHVVGIDISQELISRARTLVPGGEYRIGDVSRLTPHDFAVDA